MIDTLATAYQLALLFTNELEVPPRFKSTGKSRSNPDSQIEIRFKENVQHWNNLINTMLMKLDQEQALRFIRLKPIIESNISVVTQSKDFSDFLHYLVLRRDKEQCCKNELGRLAMLHTAFQREIEDKINNL